MARKPKALQTVAAAAGGAVTTLPPVARPPCLAASAVRVCGSRFRFAFSSGFLVAQSSNRANLGRICRRHSFGALLPQLPLLRQAAAAARIPSGLRLRQNARYPMRGRKEEHRSSLRIPSPICFLIHFIQVFVRSTPSVSGRSRRSVIRPNSRWWWRRRRLCTFGENN